MDPNSSTGNLKQAIYAREGIPPCHQRLLSPFCEYLDGSRLSQCCNHKSTVTLLLRLIGGNTTQVRVFVHGSDRFVDIGCDKDVLLDDFFLWLSRELKTTVDCIDKLSLCDNEEEIVEIKTTKKLHFSITSLSVEPEYFIEVTLKVVYPSSMTYNANGPLVFAVGINIDTVRVVLDRNSDDLNCLFSISPSLPIGLNFSQATGEINGTPLEASNMLCYTIFGRFGSDVCLRTNLTIIVSSLLNNHDENDGCEVEFSRSAESGWRVDEWISLKLFKLLHSMRRNQCRRKINNDDDTEPETKRHVQITGDDDKNDWFPIDFNFDDNDLASCKDSLLTRVSGIIAGSCEIISSNNDLYHFECTGLGGMTAFMVGAREVKEDDIDRLGQDLSVELTKMVGIECVKFDIKSKRLLLRVKKSVYQLFLTQINLSNEEKCEALLAMRHADDCLNSIVRPLLASFANNCMINYFPADGNVEDFLKSMSLCDFKPRLDNLTCSRNDKCNHLKYHVCNFHRLPRYAQLATAFIEYRTDSIIEMWDITALCGIVRNCPAFNDRIKCAVSGIRECRNCLAHDVVDSSFHKCFDYMERLLCEVGFRDKISQLKDRKSRFKAFYPAKNSIDDFNRTESRLKVLTDDQWLLVKPLIDSHDPCRQLIEAPAGSGKTLMAIKMCASKFMNRQITGKKILILTHSRALIDVVLIPGIAEELSFHNHQYSKESDNGWDNMFISPSSLNKLYVSTIDDLLRIGIGREGTSEIFSTFKSSFELHQFDSMVIDEGHHVFSRQEDSSIEGQHLVPVECVSAAIDWLLKASSQLIIFHDPLQSPTPVPIYPDNCICKSDVIHHIIRCPGRVRDFAIPFAKSIDYSSDGVVNFFPLFNRSIKGPKIVIKRAKSFAQYKSAMTDTFDELSVKYAEKLSPANVAVLFTSSFVDAASGFKTGDCMSVIECLRDVVKKNNYDWLQDSSSDNGMYWSRAENFCGLERAIVVIVCGKSDTIDASVYTAVTRCSFHLYIICNSVPTNYYNIADAAGSYAESNEAWVVKATIPSENELIVPLLLDLANPPSERILQLVKKVRIQCLSSDVWLNKTISLSSCLNLERLELNDCLATELSKERRLDMISDAIRECRDEIVDLDIGNNCLEFIPECLFAKHSLIELHLQGNEFQTVPESISSLIHLQELYLSNNKLQVIPQIIGCLIRLNRFCATDNVLTELPESIGSLSLLQGIYLSSNRLVHLPESVCNLQKLEVLSVHKNCLKSLPSSLSYLTNLNRISVSDNQLEWFPDISGCTQLQAFTARNNLLVEVPVSLTLLPSLELLDLACNRISTMPQAISVSNSLREVYMFGNPVTASKELQTVFKSRYASPGLKLHVKE